MRPPFCITRVRGARAQKSSDFCSQESRLMPRARRLMTPRVEFGPRPAALMA